MESVLRFDLLLTGRKKQYRINFDVTKKTSKYLATNLLSVK